jgi:hypothetical protein
MLVQQQRFEAESEQDFMIKVKKYILKPTDFETRLAIPKGKHPKREDPVRKNGRVLVHFLFRKNVIYYKYGKNCL